MKWQTAVACVVLAMPVAPSAVLADSIAEVEGARAMDRARGPLSRQEVEKLRRYGGNDDDYYAPHYAYGGYPGGYGGYVYGGGAYGYGGGYYVDDDDDGDEGYGYGPGYPAYPVYPY